MEIRDVDVDLESIGLMFKNLKQSGTDIHYLNALVITHNKHTHV